MPELAVLASVLILYLAALASPGPNSALIARMAMSGRTRAAWGACLGMCLVGAFYGVLAMTGLALLLERIGWLMRLVQIAGGLYLVWLGVKAWITATPEVPEGAADGAGSKPRTMRDFADGLRVGLLVDLSNPKTIVFFVSLFAVAIPPDAALWTKVAVLPAMFAMEMLFYWFAITALSTHRARRIYARFGGLIERTVGSLLILFGIRLTFR